MCHMIVTTHLGCLDVSRLGLATIKLQTKLEDRQTNTDRHRHRDIAYTALV